VVVNSSTQIRVIRVLLGMSPRDFVARIGVCAAALTSWEKDPATDGCNGPLIVPGSIYGPSISDDWVSHPIVLLGIRQHCVELRFYIPGTLAAISGKRQ
jgi:hypothetical protein